MQGHHQLEAGQSIERRTTRYHLKTAGSLRLSAPGGSITIDGSGITFDGATIRLKGPLSRQDGGSANPFAIVGTPASSKPLDRLCGRQPDGTCPLEDCTCLGGRAR
ncbi:hypothetical protein PSEWESI4_04931 [Pseudomonas carbonaria]|uniref:Type VI secretion system secreted protein VgrG n=1 Tax=Zestomonas carbonaria TaxID=2762745 RepID=A0A7U7ETD5_9GAMM|nr:hypothetical protein PSEWESI4_04931 [Pseudomonas carbonaria]